VVVDLDVHHGNGTAELLAGDPESFTFSMHGRNNFPLRKPPSTLDVPLEDGTGDDAYLAALDANLGAVLDAARADIAFYLAGVDVVAGDRFGRLAMTRAGLRARDRRVVSEARRRGLPLVVLLSGGYAATPRLTADLHAEAHRAAREAWATPA
jgi:acetoin utilization deacetylase AcuC-like enzyme